MPITDEIKKTLSDPTPLYALAGAGDLAYEKLREVPGKVEALAADRKGAQERAAARLQEAQAKVAGTVAGAAATLPEDLKVLQEKAQTFALQQVGRAVELAVKAKEAYDELAERGKVAVERGRAGEESAAGDGQPEIVEAEVVEVVEVEAGAAEDGTEAEAEPAAEDTARAAKKGGRARKSAAE